MIVGVMYFFLNNLSMLLTCNSKKLQMKALVLNPSIMDKCFIESRSSEHSTNKTRPPCKSVIFVSSSFRVAGGNESSNSSTKSALGVTLLQTNSST